MVVHYPQVPSFEYPLPIGLIELEEGTRVVANLGGVERERHRRSAWPLRAEFVDFDEELSLPVFVPAGARRGGALMDFALTDEQLAVSEAAPGSSPGWSTPSGSPPSSRATTASTATCGGRWPAPTCSVWPSPRPTAARATA